MILEKYIPGEVKNDAYTALQGMIRDIDKGKSYADMMRLRVSGQVSSACNDVYYVAHELGRALARHWNGWGKHPDAIGNWGNFYTDEQYRGQGIGGKLLQFWFEDFQSATDLPLCFLCSTGTRELASLYSRFGFRPAIEGTECGPLYMPVGDSPASFREFCATYYRPSAVLEHRPADVAYRHEIDCLLRFVYMDRDLQFGIKGLPGIEQALLYYPNRCGMLFSDDGHCVGWSFDGETQVHPLYIDSIIVGAHREYCSSP